MILELRAPSTDQLTMSTSARWKRRTFIRLERRAHVATLHEDLRRGQYHVSAGDVGESHLGHLGIAWIHVSESARQQR